jgi:hypothetical protein
MTPDDKFVVCKMLDAHRAEVQDAIRDIITRAGTWGASWTVLEAAGEIIAELRRALNDRNA